MLSEAKAKQYVIKEDTKIGQLVSEKNSTVASRLFNSMNLAPTGNVYSTDNRYENGNFLQALYNLRNEYNKAIISSPNLYTEIATAQTSITNPESFPDASNPFIHNIVLTPMVAGTVARSVPNIYAPLSPFMGLTTYSAKISRGYDRLKNLFEGSVYVRPQLKYPEVIRKINPNYEIGGNEAPYRNALAPISIPTYREKETTNIYSSTRPFIDEQRSKQYTELGYDSRKDKIDYSKLFSDSAGNKMFQQPIMKAQVKSQKDLQGGQFFNDGSMRAIKRSIAQKTNEGKFTQNLRGVIDFNKDPLQRSLEEMFFPFFIVDLRTRKGVAIKPFSEEFPKDTISPTIDEDTYIGRIGTIPRWKNASRKVSLNFFIVAESEKELWYVQDSINFLKNLLYPAYHQVQTSTNVSINLNLISTAPIVEVRYGNYLYDAGNNVGVVQGIIGELSSFDADPFRFQWEVSPGKQVPHGYRCTAEMIVINRLNPGVRINSDGTVSYSRFQEIKEETSD